MFDINNLKDEELIVAGQKLLRSISRIITDEVKYSEKEIICCLYVLFNLYDLSKNKDFIKEITRDEFIDQVNPDFKDIIASVVDEEMFNFLLEQEIDKDILGIAVLEAEEKASERLSRNSYSVDRLMFNILNNSEKKKIVEFGCETGNFLISSYLNNTKNKYFGFDERKNIIKIAKMKSEILDCDINFSVMDLLNINEDDKFDFIVVRNPFSFYGLDSLERKKLLEKLNINSLDYNIGYFSILVLGLLFSRLLSEKGKAWIIVPNLALSLVNNKKIREYYIKEGLIETIVSLPEKIYERTGLDFSLVVLSKNNKSIRMIDATKMYKAGRRRNTFTEENIKQIISSIMTNDEFGKTFYPKDLEKNNFDLWLGSYFNNETNDSLDMKVFSDIIIDKKIIRGASITAKELDDNASNEPTKIQYLMINNIKNGIIEKKLNYLKEDLPDDLKEKFKKCFIENNDLIMSRIASSEKIAIAEIEDGQKILATGNIFVIKLDKSKVNPYYLKAFFDSEVGDNFLENITTKATIKIIAQEVLLKAKIPLPKLDEQNRIAEEYKKTVAEIRDLNEKLESKKNELHNIYKERG